MAPAPENPDAPPRVSVPLPSGRRVELCAACVVVHVAAEPERVAISDVTHASCSRRRPWWGLGVVALMAGLAAAGMLEPGGETALAVLLGLMAAFHALTHLGGGALELRVGRRILAFPLAAPALASAEALVAALHAENPATARPTLTIPRLLKEALKDLFSTDARLSERLRERLLLQGSGSGELVPNALTVSRRMAAWNAGFGLGTPLLCLVLVQLGWPVPVMGSLIRGALLAPVACAAGLMLQARLTPRFKDWLVR